VKYTYLAIRSKNNQKGSFNCVQKENTNEANGVEITIPVKSEDFKEFARSFYRATFFWETRPSLKGISKFEIPEEYTHVDESFKNSHGGLFKINKEFSFGLKEEKKQTYGNQEQSITELLVVDGIPYLNPFPSLADLNCSFKGKIVQVYFFKTGDLKLPPHREEVITDKSNEDQAIKIAKLYQEKLKLDIQYKLSNCDSVNEILSLTQKAVSIAKEDVCKIALVGDFKNFRVINGTSLYNRDKFYIEFKNDNPIFMSADLDKTSGSRVKSLIMQPSFKYLTVAPKRKVRYFINDCGLLADTCASLIKKHLNSDTEQSNYSGKTSIVFVQVLKSLDNIESAIPLSRLQKQLDDKKKSAIKSIVKKQTEVVYFEISERPNVNPWGYNQDNEDKIQRITKTLAKGKFSTITNTVYMETTLNNLYSKYNTPISVQQDVILYLLSQNVRVIAFAEKNKKFFHGGVDFKDALENLFNLFPMNDKNKNGFLFQNLSRDNRTNKDCLFSEEYDFLGEQMVQAIIPQIKDKNIQYLLSLKSLCSRKLHERYFTYSFIEKFFNKELLLELKKIQFLSKSFIKEHYVFRMSHGLNNDQGPLLLKYLNEKK
jgi:hypothetical protein